MSRKFARLYTVSKTKWRYGQYTNIYGKDDTLFSGGIYPTKIKIDDLPDWYVFGRFYKHWGYLSGKASKVWCMSLTDSRTICLRMTSCTFLMMPR